jgi:hypothetical protein
MDRSSRNLLTYALFILGSVAVTLVGIGAEIYLGGFAIPDGTTQEALDITKIFVLAISAVMLLPQIYIGIKGICVARNPDSSYSHIFLGGILLAITLVSLVLSVGGIFTGSEDVSYTALVEQTFQVIFYIGFLISANQVRNGD